ncbi:hypothetical protein ACFE04_018515 [Oxalis oulophora]
MQNCLGNGRPDKEYESWRWKPSEYELPRFDGKKFLGFMRGKTLAFIGDSVARKQMEFMLCLLWQLFQSGYYDTPGHSTTTMAYSADGTRLFSCVTNKEGESYLVEWNESEGAVKHSYLGLGRRCMGIVQFDTTKNHFLVAGDDSMIKIWDMEYTTLLHSNDVEGRLPHSPVVRFNKEGTLLAVSTNDNGIEILANADGVRFLKTLENRAFDPSKANSLVVVKPAMPSFGSGNVSIGVTIGERKLHVQAMVAMSNDSRDLADAKPRIGEESVDKSRIWKLTEINEPSQCRSLRLADNLAPRRISRLIYTNSGLAVLALESNVVHKLWKLQRNDRNLSGKIVIRALARVDVIDPTLRRPGRFDAICNNKATFSQFQSTGRGAPPSNSKGINHPRINAVTWLLLMVMHDVCAFCLQITLPSTLDVLSNGSKEAGLI